jgi:hypothetical protein
MGKSNGLYLLHFLFKCAMFVVLFLVIITIMI